MPKDVFMLYSFINMRLRDDGITLDELCSNYGEDSTAISEKLQNAGFYYDAENNRLLQA